ncbi:MAG TPA: hypothetical protein VK796_08385 [Cytophaga sp.]|jgi:hypothetical protein|nr:hypothetical protein [Cytophaga sp.]
MYKASIKHILMTILAKELLIKHIEIHAIDRFDTDLFLSDDEFNRLLYFVEMNFNIDLSNQDITLHDRISDLVACIYQITVLDRQYALQSA